MTRGRFPKLMIKIGMTPFNLLPKLEQKAIRYARQCQRQEIKRQMWKRYSVKRELGQ